MTKELASNSELPVAEALCSYCEAPLSADQDVCRSCRIPTAYHGALNPFQPPNQTAPKVIADETKAASSLVGIMLTGLLFMVLLGLGVMAPGAAILLALLTIPPWIRTVLVMRRRSKAGLETGRGATVAMFVGSVFVTWLILFVALISCFLTFCFACIGALAVSKDDSVITAMAGLASLAAFVVIVLAFSPWIRQRYRHDIQKK